MTGCHFQRGTYTSVLLFTLPLIVAGTTIPFVVACSNKAGRQQENCDAPISSMCSLHCYILVPVGHYSGGKGVRKVCRQARQTPERGRGKVGSHGKRQGTLLESQGEDRIGIRSLRKGKPRADGAEEGISDCKIRSLCG